jgi:hypothetical protein
VNGATENRVKNEGRRQANLDGLASNCMCDSCLARLSSDAAAIPGRDALLVTNVLVEMSAA